MSKPGAIFTPGPTSSQILFPAFEKVFWLEPEPFLHWKGTKGLVAWYKHALTWHAVPPQPRSPPVSDGREHIPCSAEKHSSPGPTLGQGPEKELSFPAA